MEITDIIKTDCTPQIEVYYNLLWSEFNMDMHRHNRMEIMYVKSGTCKIMINDKTEVLKKEMFILLDANVFHKLAVKKGEPCRMITIEFSFKHCLGSNLVMSDLICAYPEIYDVLHSINQYAIFKDTINIGEVLKAITLLKDEGAKDYFINTYFAQLFIKLGIIGKREDSSENIMVAGAEKFIKENYQQDIKVSDIAAYVNLNVSYLHKIFKKVKGITPIEYLTDLRIEIAKRMLYNTNFTITEICDMVGMGSRQYFSYCFKKNCGETPIEFRQKARKSFGIDNKKPQ